MTINLIGPQYNLLYLKPLLMLEAEVKKFLLLKPNQVYGELASKQTEGKNTIAIWYLYENELIWDFWGRTGLKYSQN